MFQFQYEYEFQDLIALNRVDRKVYRRWTSGMIRIFGLIVAGANLLMAGFLLWMDGFPKGLVNLLFALILLAILFLHDRLNAWSSRRMMLKDTGLMTVTLENNGVRYHNRKEEGLYRWEAFISIFLYQERYFLFLDKKHAVVLPERALLQGDSVALKAFLNEKTGKEIKKLI